MQKMYFRCDTNEKMKFMRQAEEMELNAAFLLRRMVHLFLTDRIMRDRVMNLQVQNCGYDWEF